MTPQKPAVGICQMTSYPDMKVYKLPCECHCDNEIEFSIEVDEHGFITANFNAKVKTPHWRSRLHITYDEPWIIINLKSLYNDVCNRLEIIWNALTKGWVEGYCDVIMSKQQTLNFSQTLRDAIEECKAVEEKRQAEFAAEQAKKNDIPS